LDIPKSDWIEKLELYTQTIDFNINLHGQ